LLADSLRFTSAISILLAVLFMCISLGIAIYALFQGKTETPRLFPDFDHLPSFFDIFTAVPVIVVAFTFHFNGNYLAWPCANKLGLQTFE
jgi:amino acid permease